MTQLFAAFVFFVSASVVAYTCSIHIGAVSITENGQVFTPCGSDKTYLLADQGWLYDFLVQYGSESSNETKQAPHVVFRGTLSQQLFKKSEVTYSGYFEFCDMEIEVVDECAL